MACHLPKRLLLLFYSKKRITLRNTIYEYFHIEEYEDGEQQRLVFLGLCFIVRMGNPAILRYTMLGINFEFSEL